MRPRCFGKLRALPCDYGYSRRAWMTRQLWQKIVENLEKMKNEKRKIALIVDGVTTHKKLPPERFEHVTIFYLPPGTTSKSQPMDAGVLLPCPTCLTLLRCNTCRQVALSTSSHSATFGHVQSWRKPICVSARLYDDAACRMGVCAGAANWQLLRSVQYSDGECDRTRRGHCAGRHEQRSARSMAEGESSGLSQTFFLLC